MTYKTQRDYAMEDLKEMLRVIRQCEEEVQDIYDYVSNKGKEDVINWKSILDSYTALERDEAYLSYTIKSFKFLLEQETKPSN